MVQETLLLSLLHKVITEALEQAVQAHMPVAVAQAAMVLTEPIQI